MQQLIYTSFFLLFYIIPFSVSGQEVISHVGGAGSDNWDALSYKDDGEMIFAMGFRQETLVNGQNYAAIDRDVLLGSYREADPEIFGQLSSAGHTEVAFIKASPAGFTIGGNAFSFLVYRDDTLFSDQGVNKAFVLDLDEEGNPESMLVFEAAASAIMVDGEWLGNELSVLLQITDTLSIGQQLFIPKAERAGLILQFDQDLGFQNGALLDGEGSIMPVGLEADTGFLYAGGNFQGALYYGADTIQTRTADDDVFLVKIHRSGDLAFLKHIRGVYQDELRDLDVSNERIFLCGQFIGAIAFDQLEVITGLSVAGFAGTFDTEGNALWLEALFGDNNITSFEKIHISENELSLAAFVGMRSVFQNDTIQIASMPGQINSLLFTLSMDGSLKKWSTFEGSPLFLISDVLSLSGQEKVIAAVFSGHYQQISSRGAFDLLLLRESTSFLSPVIRSVPVIYPNPVLDMLCLEDSPEIGRYSIYNTSGILIMEGKVEGDCIDVGHLQSGYYVFLYLSEQLKSSSFYKR